MMRIFQTFSMAMKSIFNNKMRSLLTMLGIIIGVMSVITLVSVMRGSQAKIMESYAKMGTNRISVYYYTWDGSDFAGDLYKYCQSLSAEVEGVTPSAAGWMTLRYRTKSMDTRISFGSDQFDLCQNYTLAAGRSLCYADIYNRVKVCVLGSRVAQEFFNLENPVGKTIKIRGDEYTVVGVFQSKYNNQEGSDDDMILVPYTHMRSVLGNSQITEFTVKATSAQNVNVAVNKIGNWLSERVKQGYFDVYSNSSYIEQQNESNMMLTLLVGGIAGISLLVGGIGIMNIMLVSVAERTREIGIRMAIGAKRRDIVTQFLIEAATISACGGVIGIAMGAMGSALLSSAILKEVYLPDPTITIGAFLFSVVLGVFFGFYPANKASKMQPVEALRNQ